jgi:hypothetical protein
MLLIHKDPYSSLTPEYEVSTWIVQYKKKKKKKKKKYKEITFHLLREIDTNIYHLSPVDNPSFTLSSSQLPSIDTSSLPEVGIFYLLYSHYLSVLSLNSSLNI